MYVTVIGLTNSSFVACGADLTYTYFYTSEIVPARPHPGGLQGTSFSIAFIVVVSSRITADPSQLNVSLVSVPLGSV